MKRLGLSLPKQEEEDTKEDGENADTDRLGFLENLDDAVHEGSDPQEPFQERRKHERANDGDIDNLGGLDRGYKFLASRTYVFGFPRVCNVRYAGVGTGKDARHVVRHHDEY